jgi:branched-chain amino acid transport system permease protein
MALTLALFAVAWGALDFPVFYLIFVAGIMFWTAQATSWNILSGYSGYFSFGQGAFYGVGVYTMAVAFGRHGWHWLIAILLGGVLAMLLALGIGALAFRLRSLRGEIFALLTLAFPFMLASIVRLSNAIDGGQGIVVPVPTFPEALGPFQRFYFVLSAIVGVLAVLVALWMHRTRYGWSLFAIHDDESVAEGLGVPTFFHKMIAIGGNGLIAGMSGAVFALNLGFVSVESTFTLRVPLFVILMSVLGGRSHWAGPMVGAVYVYTIQNRLTDAGFEGWSLIILGVILIALVLLAPEGLMARFVRRPWWVAGGAMLVFAVLALSGVWGEPVDWLVAALAAAVVVAFVPGRKAPAAVRDHAGGLGDAAGLADVPALPAPPIGEPLVVASEVAKDFGGVHALRGVSMTVSEGELIGLVGPNGSGKTTLVNLVSGAFAPTSGSITLDGHELTRLQPHRIAHLGVARTYQIPRPFASLTVRDNVAIAIMFGREPRGLEASRQAADEYLGLVGLSDLASVHPGQVNLHERQLLEMARAMATRPSVLLLDEALAGLNPAEVDNAAAVVRRIHRTGVAIVLVEHVLRVVNQLATRIVVLDQGRQLAAGEPAEVMGDPAVVTAYLGRQGNAPGH